ALAYRTDQWIWVSGGTVQSTLGTKIPTLSNVTINGSGKLGFTDSGTAKYAGTAVISANKQTISIPVAVGLAKPVIRK
ncbi:hypothetical protein EBR96_08595, partial [bacterium]|nr:hypothetical protein [bacterium]